MASRIIQFIWTGTLPNGAVDVKTHALVAALTDDEWDDVEWAADWLTAKNRTIITSLTPTKALGGEHHELLAVLKVVADQYNYPSYGVDNPVLKKHGIERKPPGPGV